MLPSGGALHAIFRSRQNKQAITGLRRPRRFVDGSLNMPCPAFGFGAEDTGVSACDNLLVPASTECVLEVGVPTSNDGNDEDSGVCIGALGE